MKWNLNELHQKIISYEIRINSISNEIDKQSLLMDLYNLKNMINYSYGKKIYLVDDFESKMFFNLDYINDMIDFLNKNREKFLLKLNDILYMNKMPWKNCCIQKLKVSEYERLLKDFFENFDFNLFHLYENYKIENKIEFNNNKYSDSKGCLGRCYYLINEGTSYLSIRSSSNIQELTILPHELAHAYQFNNDKNIISVQNKMVSLLCEAFSIFIEYIFLDFLKTTEYRDFAFMKEGIYLDNFICILEYNFNNLAEDFNLKKFLDTKKLNSLMLSNLVAIYWLKIYRENPSELLKNIQSFNADFGNSLMSSFFDNIDIDEFINSVHTEMRYYLLNYKKRNL